jgi:hypothetical protein
MALPTHQIGEVVGVWVIHGLGAWADGKPPGLFTRRSAEALTGLLVVP